MRYPQDCRGHKATASARPTHGGRFSPAGAGADLSLFGQNRLRLTPRAKGRENALRFLTRP